MFCLTTEDFKKILNTSFSRLNLVNKLWYNINLYAKKIQSILKNQEVF